MQDRPKCAVITGAAGGIGVELARRLATDGWRLHLCDVNQARLEEMCKHLPDSTTFCESQLDTPQACVAALPHSCDEGDESDDEGGDIDALIHLAGIFEFHELDANGHTVYNKTIQHNTTNAYDMSAAIVPRMSPGGRIVFTSSLAFNRGSPDNIAYAMAKGALVGLTRALSRKLGPDGILVNAVAPGFIETPMLRRVMLERDEEACISSVPLGRLGRASEVASVLAFLLSEDASYITGQLINIDGGLINS